MMNKMFHPDPNKSSHELEQESQEIIPSNKSSMIFKPGELLSKIRLANFCEHYSFISSIEPMKVEEALEDPGWINAMHEELHNFERNQVWTLVEKPDNNHNIIGTKLVFCNKQDEMDKWSQQSTSRRPSLHTS